MATLEAISGHFSAPGAALCTGGFCHPALAPGGRRPGQLAAALPLTHLSTTSSLSLSPAAAALRRLIQLVLRHRGLLCCATAYACRTASQPGALRAVFGSPILFGDAVVPQTCLPAAPPRAAWRNASLHLGSSHAPPAPPRLILALACSGAGGCAATLYCASGRRASGTRPALVAQRRRSAVDLGTGNAAEHRFVWLALASRADERLAARPTPRRRSSGERRACENRPVANVYGFCTHLLLRAWCPTSTPPPRCPRTRRRCGSVASLGAGRGRAQTRPWLLAEQPKRQTYCLDET